MFVICMIHFLNGDGQGRVKREVLGGRDKIFGCRNKNKTKVGFDLVTGAFLLIIGGSRVNWDLI